MSKTTTLKYLEGLKGKGLITCEMIGPTKLWSLANEDGEGRRAENNVQLGDKGIEDFIHVDKEIYKLLDEFESATGKRLEILINNNGVKLRVWEKAA